MSSYIDTKTTTQINEICDKIVNDTELYTGSEYKQNMYIAGPWFDTKAKKIMNTIHRIVDLTPSGMYNVYFPMEHTKDSPRQTFKDNVENIENADIIVALVSRKDCGTSFEVGMAYALGKRIVFVVLDYLDATSKTNIMLSYAADKIIDLKDFQKLLCKVSVNSYDVKDSWEGKE